MPPAQIARLYEKVSKGIHIKDTSRFTDKAQRCHKHLMAKGNVSNVYAVCNASLGSSAYKKKR